ncbi:alpha-2-macroglobulin family protein [Antarcticimicrobium luteum]|uniref:Alpha-2-macroglobulin family protein n=1 Tax=Antarcticimicrobium luteum TaxID=2547397 RepID=A0A4R5VF22_9RHOB|nr:alpha-2-macroglobulin family protein [Antarcticimicrobium luteum]TDK51075.1 alpha-2-macroglobulin family protein [Antarcticimicrobium luteum]
MERILRAALGLVFAALWGISASAQQATPEFRYVVTNDMDFYGSDLDALFDTDLPSCLRACTANPRCVAFTYNTRSNSCFPKSGVRERAPYDGALSAEKLTTPAAVTARGLARAVDLDFLGESDLAQARDRARTLGLIHRAGGMELKAVLDAMTESRQSGNLQRAANWTGAVVSLTDAGAYWSEYARLMLLLRSDSSSRQRDYERRAQEAAINGYLRADTDAARATALSVLAQALERRGRGRDMIPALRLASDIQPRDDILAALDDAIGKYGFRITDSSVESDTDVPRICAEFSEGLVKAGVDYEPFLRLPAPELAVQPQGRQLCVDGLEHGTRYRITFRRGLPAASGEVLQKDVTLTHYVQDRSPTVRFPGRAYVLPKSADAALPVETVNVDTLDLTLRRVSDRNLIRAMQQDYFARPLSYWQEEDFADSVAQQVWTGTAEVGNALNRDMTTRLPMGEAIAGQGPGIYVLTARVPGADPYDDPGATQWFVLSDLGLTTISGTEGLHVQVAGLSDAQPRAGVEVTLVSRANAVLGKGTTDAEGHTLFDAGLTRGSGGGAPALVVARQGEDDLSFLSLTEPAFDLSDRGVEGRPPAGPVDVFLTTDRGAYRAGETIHATALARDGAAKAIKGLPLIAILSRPDGVEYRRRISGGGDAGGHVFSFPVGASAPRGSWRLEIRTDPDAPALASQTVLVEDFLPERIDFDLALPDAPLRAGDTPPLSITARYLFGAPGADLSVEGQVLLRPATEVAGWPGYRFGRHDAAGRAESSYFGGARTDAQGLATVAVELPRPEAGGQPLEATVIARLADGSARPVERRLSVPVRPDGPVIGIKPMFDEVVAEGTEAGFQVIGLSPELTPEPMAVRWTLNRVTTRYQWYQLYGNWNWEPVTRRARIAGGEATLGGAPLVVSAPVDWGEYELVVERTDGRYAASSVDFYAGWYVAADAASTPDRLDLSLDRESYAVGDTAKLRIVPRAGGTALITVMADRVISRRAVTVEAGETVIPLEVTADWGTGAYVEATVIRPMDVAAGQNPARAIGLAHAAIDPGDKALQVTIDAPELTRPRGSERVRVTVAGAAEGERAWLTLAAVDLGILNLTGFESPDPQGHYFGQRRLGVELRDVYGRLIDGMNGAMGVVRSGGDADAGMRMQSPPPTQDLMAVFSGPVQVGPDGAVFVNIELPDFNGTVRLMAVAWTLGAVGQAEADMLVRDPVVVTASLPRFLAPGDESRIRLEVVHADGPAGRMALDLTARGPGIALGAGPAPFDLTEGGKAVVEVPVRAVGVGDPIIELALTTPDGQTLTQSLRLPVRSNDPVVAQTRRFSLGAGDRFVFSDDVFAGLMPGTASAILSAGPLARFDAPGLLARLDRYPYGCTEQVTSKALPLLYLSSVARATGLGDGPAVDARIAGAVSRILTRQAPNGSFGLWRAESGDFWLDAYVTDFLSRAKAEGHQVPDRAFRQALDNLRNRVNYAPDFDAGDDAGRDVAYALMVLAREGAAAMGDLRYYADVKADDFATPLAAAQLGAALAAYGDQPRADAMFARAAKLIENRPETGRLWRADYGTDLRDAAGVLALAAEAGSAAVDRDALTARITRADLRPSTQEAAWSLLAAHALIASPEQSGLRVDGAPITGPFVQMRADDTPAPGVEITAADGQATDITLTTLGVPQVAPEAGGTGYAISRKYYSLEGVPVDGDRFAVGERMVAVIEVTPFEAAGARLMVDDPLPAGFEIDNPNLLRSGDVRALDWLKPSAAEHAEFRSDRFLAALDMREAKKVTLAYIVRAVTPGVFHHPAASVEDMYRPRFRARGETGQVTVTR